MVSAGRLVSVTVSLFCATFSVAPMASKNFTGLGRSSAGAPKVYCTGMTILGWSAVIVSEMVVLSSSSGGVTGTNRTSACPIASI